jgi:hypothetical protein
LGAAFVMVNPLGADSPSTRGMIDMCGLTSHDRWVSAGMTAPVTILDAPSPPPPGGRHRRVFIGLLTAVVVTAVLVALAAVVLISRVAAARHTAVAPLGDTTAATVDIAGGVTSVTVRSADLGRDLYRISTPGDSRQVPSVSTSDGASVTVRTSGDGPGRLEVLLSSRVTWRVRVSGGATEARLDLRGAPVAGVALASGVSTAELWLPAPRGLVEVSETGGTNGLILHVAARVPVKVTVDGGAGTATLDGATHTGVSAGTTFAPDRWDTVTDRYDVRLVGGVSHVDLDRFAG